MTTTTPPATGAGAFRDPAAPSLASLLEALAASTPCRRGGWPICARRCAACAGCWASRRARSRPTPACSAAPCAGPCPRPPASAPARWANIKSLVAQGACADRLQGPARPLAAPADPGLGGARGPAAGPVLPGRALAPDALLLGAGDRAGGGRPGGVRPLRGGDPGRQLHPQPAGRAPERGPALEPGGRHHPGLAAGGPSSSRATPGPTSCRWPPSRPRSRPRSRPGCAGSPARAPLEEGPLRPLRPRSLEQRRFYLRQAASALVHGGRDPASITGLADLVTVEAMQAILRFFLARSGNRPTSQIHGLATHLKAIARHHVGAPPAVLEQLGRMVRRVAPPQTGLALKNRLALQQFADPVLLAAAGPAAGRDLCHPAGRGHAAAAARGAALPVGPGGAAPAGGPAPARQSRRARARPPPAAQRRQRPAAALPAADPGRARSRTARPSSCRCRLGPVPCSSSTAPGCGRCWRRTRHQLPVPGRARRGQGAGHAGRPDQPLPRARARRAADPAPVPPSDRLHLPARAPARHRGGPRPARPPLDRHHAAATMPAWRAPPPPGTTTTPCALPVGRAGSAAGRARAPGQAPAAPAAAA